MTNAVSGRGSLLYSGMLMGMVALTGVMIAGCNADGRSARKPAAFKKNKDQAGMKNKLLVLAPLMAAQAFGARENFDFDWEFARKDFQTSFGKVGLAPSAVRNSNNNGNATVAADAD